MRIFAFGDSFTDSYNDICANWVKAYVDWKGYRPKSFIDILSNVYDSEILNFAKGGNDNYTIIESFIKVFPEITKDDLILINWSNVERFRAVNINDEWRPIIPNFKGFLFDEFDLSKKTVEEMLVNRTSKKYVEEILNYIDFIYFICKDYKIFQWSIQEELKGSKIDFYTRDFETIYEETKGIVKDKHPSENGNKKLAKDIRDYLEKKYVMTKKTII